MSEMLYETEFSNYRTKYNHIASWKHHIVDRSEDEITKLLYDSLIFDIFVFFRIIDDDFMFPTTSQGSSFRNGF